MFQGSPYLSTHVDDCVVFLRVVLDVCSLVLAVFFIYFRTVRITCGALLQPQQPPERLYSLCPNSSYL